LGIGNKLLNGFEVNNKNKKNPEIIICWKKRVKSLYFFGWFFELTKNKNIKSVKTSNQSNKLPS
jgi:hypothetical protein